MCLSRATRVSILAIVFAAALLGASFVAMLSWNSMEKGVKVATESYIDVPSGKGGEVRSYGDYCSQDETILDGGIVCHTSTKIVQYTIVERVARSVAYFALVILLVIVVLPYNIVFSWRRPQKTRENNEGVKI